MDRKSTEGMFLDHNTENTGKYVSIPKTYKRRNGAEKKRKEVKKKEKNPRSFNFMGNGTVTFYFFSLYI